MANHVRFISYDPQIGLNKAVFKHSQIAGYTRQGDIGIIVYLVNNPTPISIVASGSNGKENLDKFEDTLSEAISLSDN